MYFPISWQLFNSPDVFSCTKIIAPQKRKESLKISNISIFTDPLDKACQTCACTPAAISLDSFVGEHTPIEGEQLVSARADTLRLISYQGSVDVDWCLKLIGKYCENIEKVELTLVENLNFKLWRRILRSFPKLKTVYVSHTFIGDEICEILASLPVQHLYLKNLKNISGRFINKIENLSVLDISFCQNVIPKELKAVFQACKLKALNIRAARIIDNLIFESMEETQKSLRTLMLSNNYFADNIDLIAQLKSLKCIELYWERSDNLCYDLFISLAKQKHTTLKTLVLSNMWISSDELLQDELIKLIHLKKLVLAYDRYINDKFLNIIATTMIYLNEFACPAAVDVTEEGVLNFMQKAKSINILDVSECVKLTTNLIYNMIKVLKEKTSKLTMRVGKTKIANSIVNDKKYLVNTNLLTLSFLLTYGDTDIFMMYDLDENEYGTIEDLNTPELAPPLKQ